MNGSTPLSEGQYKWSIPETLLRAPQGLAWPIWFRAQGLMHPQWQDPKVIQAWHRALNEKTWMSLSEKERTSWRLGVVASCQRALDKLNSSHADFLGYVVSLGWAVEHWYGAQRPVEQKKWQSEKWSIALCHEHQEHERVDISQSDGWWLPQTELRHRLYQRLAYDINDEWLWWIARQSRRSWSKASLSLWLEMSGAVTAIRLWGDEWEDMRVLSIANPVFHGLTICMKWNKPCGEVSLT